MRNYTSCSHQRILLLGILFQLKIFQPNLSTWFHSQINPDFHLIILEPQGIGLGVKVSIPCVANCCYYHEKLGIAMPHGNMEEE
ncbi:hypothetical protein L6164_006477 [Bauhinia variegata]|uniref:Uncharacterized protein n=1 Tax=Bauhinia variegata TaxID=167791 RepID=A0ACB9PUL7_BAUVA|nr:hypothetical protein L6164_006477 [Bauhinia variegata]